jgi:hypothetical protein
MWMNSLALEQQQGIKGRGAGGGGSGGGSGGGGGGDAEASASEGLLYVNNLFADVQDGVAIIRVMDRIQPGLVVWRRVNIKPKNRYKKVSYLGLFW